MKWQPIETAPRNGEIILLWVPREAERGCISGGWWSSSQESWYIGPWRQASPTHWVPLPDGPDKDVKMSKKTLEIIAQHLENQAERHRRMFRCHMDEGLLDHAKVWEIRAEENEHQAKLVRQLIDRAEVNSGRDAGIVES